MQSKILLIALSVAALSSCSTAYKTGQTPDDVYYSPAKVVEVKKQTERTEERYQTQTNSDYEITMSIRDRRWRDFRNDYQYDYSPYNYCYSGYKNYGYYYNPYYYPWAIYTTSKPPVNTTPRMVNLNTYNGYNRRVAAGKTNGTLNYSNNTSQYNNSNRSSSRVNTYTRQATEPTYTPPSNNSRTYTPSSSGSSSSGSSSGSSSSSSRPARGG